MNTKEFLSVTLTLIEFEKKIFVFSLDCELKVIQVINAMKFLLQVFVVVSSLLFDSHVIAEDEVKCNEIKIYDWTYVSEQLTCYISISYISWSGVTISKVEEPVTALCLKGNERVIKLPVEVSKTFPHLIAYNAASCSVKSIQKANFVNLTELEVLDLQNNQIRVINRDTFEDLVSLKVLNLSRNKIKLMSASVFRRLTQAHYITLYGNECIDEGFTSSREIMQMFEIVNANCGFYDSEDVFKMNEEVKLKITRLETQLETEIEGRKQLQNQLALINQVLTKIEAQLNSTCLS